jgi:hypothetical protein
MFRKVLINSSIFFSILIAQDLSAQQRFKAGIVAGVNAAQIRGDNTGGFNKLGLVGGLRAIAVLTDKTDLSMELTYSQRGSKNDKNEPVNIQIDLNYIEVPVTYGVKDWYIEDGDYYKVQASGGLAYSRLLKATTQDLTGPQKDVTEEFSTNDFGIVLGAEFFLNKHWSLSGRWISSFNLLAEAENSPSKNSLRGYFLSFRINYIF